MPKHSWVIGVVCLFGMIAWSVMPLAADSGQQKQTSTQTGPVAARQAPAEDGRPQINSTDRCPVCGMFPAKRPQNAAALVLNDGRAFYFCGNGCLLRVLRDPNSYLNVPAQSIRRAVVLDYFSGAPLDAQSAWWVEGSDVVGPMGPAWVTLKDQKSVDQFKARHGAKKVFQLEATPK